MMKNLLEESSEWQAEGDYAKLSNALDEKPKL